MSSNQKWSKDHVGMVKYSGYWGKFSLVIDVKLYEDGHLESVTELDAFGAINHGDSHKLRTHYTDIGLGDRFYTVQEFSEMVLAGSVIG